MDKRAAIYVRVSTDKQTIENQLRELRQIAERQTHRRLRWRIRPPPTTFAGRWSRRRLRTLFQSSFSHG